MTEARAGQPGSGAARAEMPADPVASVSAAAADSAGVPDAGPLLSARDIRVHFNVGSPLAARIRNERHVLRAVDGVDLDLRRGEALALVGESGSGKSTFALALAGLRAVDSGEVRFDGRILPARRSRADLRRIQMVFQDPYSSLNPRCTVGGMLRELLRVHQIVPSAQVDARCQELLALVGLGEDALRAYPRQFSGGQRQRVAIARALALVPDVLVADEPVSALDVSVQATILNLLRDLRGELGLTLLLISHNLAVVRHLCSRVAVMYLGRIVEEAPTERLFGDPRHPYTRGLLAAIPRLGDQEPSHGHDQTDDGPAVAGDPPSALRIPAGCRFRTRCPIAQQVCETDDPELTAAAGDSVHRAACHFAFDADPPARAATWQPPAPGDMSRQREGEQ